MTRLARWDLCSSTHRTVEVKVPRRPQRHQKPCPLRALLQAFASPGLLCRALMQPRPFARRTTGGWAKHPDRLARFLGMLGTAVLHSTARPPYLHTRTTLGRVPALAAAGTESVLYLRHARARQGSVADCLTRPARSCHTLHQGWQQPSPSRLHRNLATW